MTDYEKVALKAGLNKIADFYGFKHQLLKLREEANELIEAIDDYDTTEPRRKHLLEEMGDVYNVLDEITYLLKAEDEIADDRNYKVDRTLKRMVGLKNE